MNHFFNLILLCITFSCYGQSNSHMNNNFEVNQDSIVYLKKCIAFIKEVNKKDLSNTYLILSDKPYSFNYSNCIKELLLDSSTFTKEEFSSIKNGIYPSLTKWTIELLGNIKIVSHDTIRSIIRDESKGWSYFHKKIGHDYTSFSVPIFSRNGKYCLFYSEYNCGSLCGVGGLTLYIKKNNKWRALKNYCVWAS